MSKRKNGGRLSDAKGADLLANMRANMPDSTPPQPNSNKLRQDGLERELQTRPHRTPRMTRQGRAAVAKAKAAEKKEIIRLPRHMIEEALRLASGSQGTFEPPPKNNDTQNDFGAAAHQCIENLRPALEQFIADCRAPTAVSDNARAVVERRITQGADASSSIVDPDADGYIGLDFGTSSTKTVVRWPYDRARGAFAINTPLECSSGEVPHLWPTVVYFSPIDGCFALLPGANRTPLSGFKSALIERRGHRICAGSGVRMDDAATAFLALHLAYVLGAILDRDSSAQVSGINVGIPVAALADETNCSAFRDIVGAAISLIPNAKNLSLKDVQAARADRKSGPLPFDVFTELSGAIAGYCAGPRPFLGAHMIIDCGSATLDIASFQLGDGTWPVGIHAAAVEPLGADACEAYMNAGAAAEDCGRSVYYCEHTVYSQSIHRGAGGFHLRDGRYPYQVILVGGGLACPVHASLFGTMESAFHIPFHRPTLERALVCDDGFQPGRLILADGLARAPVDLREVSMPRDHPKVVHSCVPEMISKDQV